MEDDLEDTVNINNVEFSLFQSLLWWKMLSK